MNFLRKSRSRDKDECLETSSERSQSERQYHPGQGNLLIKLKKQPTQVETCSDDEPELVRKKRSKSSFKLIKPLSLSYEQVDFTSYLQKLSKRLHSDSKLQLNPQAALLLNDCLNDVAKKIMTHA